MASLLCRAGNYYATFHDSARTPAQRRLSLKTTNKRTAEKMLRRLGEGYAAGDYDPWVQAPADFLAPEREAAPTKLSEAVARFFAGKELSPATGKSYRSRLRGFVQAIGEGRPLASVTRDEVQAFVNSRPTPGTAESDLTAIKSLFTFCRENEWTKADPAARVIPPKAAPRLPRAVLDDELSAVLTAVRPGRAWCRPVFEFAALTGLRCSELARLEWDHVDFERRMLRIETQKSGKAGTQPISRAAAALLESLPRLGVYVFTSPDENPERQKSEARNTFAWSAQIQRTFRLAKTAAGITRKLSPHGLRHRYCTKLAEAGASAFVIQAAARHADVQTSQRYVSIANETLKAELDSVFG